MALANSKTPFCLIWQLLCQPYAALYVHVRLQDVDLNNHYTHRRVVFCDQMPDEQSYMRAHLIALALCFVASSLHGSVYACVIMQCAYLHTHSLT